MWTMRKRIYLALLCLCLETLHNLKDRIEFMDMTIWVPFTVSACRFGIRSFALVSSESMRGCEQGEMMMDCIEARVCLRWYVSMVIFLFYFFIFRWLASFGHSVAGNEMQNYFPHQFEWAHKIHIQFNRLVYIRKCVMLWQQSKIKLTF